MDLSRTTPLKFMACTVQMFLWCVLIPIIYLFGQYNYGITIWTYISLLGVIVSCHLCYGVLRDVAEPYEIDRIKYIWKLLLIIRPTPFVFIVCIVGYLIISVVSNISAGDIEPTTSIIKLMSMFFGTFLIIVSCRWWMDDIKWKINIDGIKLPKSDWL